MKKNEAGITLIELLTALSISALIVGVLTGAIILMLNNTDASQQRLSQSHDKQIIASYFVSDIESSTAVSISSPTFKSVLTGTSSDAFATFSFTNALDSTKTDKVEYIDFCTSTEHQLLRRYTPGGGSTQPVDIIAHELATCGAIGSSDALTAITPTCSSPCSSNTKFTLTFTSKAPEVVTYSAIRRVG